MTLPLSTAPEHICILRLSAVGDVCHAVAVVRRIQRYWPQTRITWVIGKLEASLVGDIPGIEFIVFDKSRGLLALNGLRKQMHGRRFDVLLHMQVSLRASIASVLIPAKIRLGFDKKRARDYQWLFTNHKIKAVREQHVMEGLFEFANTLGVVGHSLEWNIPIPAEAARFAAEAIPDDRPYLVISPCSSNRFRNWRNWDAPGYAKVVDYAFEKYGLMSVLTGGPTRVEKEYGEKITDLSNHKPINLIGQTSLKQLLAILKKASCLVSPDSGPAHMATTVDTPVIGLYVTSNPARTGPYNSQQWVVNKYTEAIYEETGLTVAQLPWGKRVRNPDAMSRIQVEDVTDKIDRLLQA